MTVPVVLADWPAFPNPFSLFGDWVGDLAGAGAKAVGGALAGALEWLVSTIVGSLSQLAASVLRFFWDAADPHTGAAWFSGSGSTPYRTMVLLSAPLLVAFLLAGVLQGALRGDAAGMVRMTLLRLPGAVLAMTMTVAVVDVLLAASNEMSEAVLGGFRDDVESATKLIGTLAVMPGLSPAGQLLTIVFGLVGLLAAMVFVIELFVRSALIYIVVALSPLVYAASVWESLRGAVRKLGELGLALILSKFAIAVTLALAGAAMTATWGHRGGVATQVTTPEQAAAAGGGDVTRVLGVLVAAIVMFGVGAFMPFVLFRLLPIAEAAVVGQGIRGGALRAAQQGHHTAMMARYNPATAALRSTSHPRSTGTGPTGGGPPTCGYAATGSSAAGGAGGGGAALGAAGVAAGQAARGVQRTVSRAGGAAVAQSAGASGNGDGPVVASTGSRRPAPGGRRPADGHKPDAAPPGRGRGQRR